MARLPSGRAGVRIVRWIVAPSEPPALAMLSSSYTQVSPVVSDDLADAFTRGDWREAIRLMIKYAGLHLMTSAWAPRYLPPELLHYMNTRGRSKVMFASDHPVLSLERCVTEARQLDLRDGVLEAYLHGNAERVLLGLGA